MNAAPVTLYEAMLNAERFAFIEHDMIGSLWFEAIRLPGLREIGAAARRAYAFAGPRGAGVDGDYDGQEASSEADGVYA